MSENIRVDTAEKISYKWHEKIVEDIKAQQRYMFDTKSAQDERTIKRLWIVIIIVFAAFVLSNAGWIIYESQYSTEQYSYELSQDSGDGGENTYTNNRVFIGGDYNGETGSQGNSQTAGSEKLSGTENMP